MEHPAQPGVAQERSPSRAWLSVWARAAALAAAMPCAFAQPGPDVAQAVTAQVAALSVQPARQTAALSASSPLPSASPAPAVADANPAGDTLGLDGRPATPPPARATPLSLKASVAALRARMQPWRSSSSDNAPDALALRTGPNIQVIELPREGAQIGPPPKRAHHALSIGMEGPKQMLRGLGLDATECAGRFRMPSKLNRKGDGSTSVDISAQLGMACKF